MPSKLSINGHHVGLVMREACTRAMEHALDRCFEVEAEAKGLKANGDMEWVTKADRECQKLVVGTLQEHFPLYGIVGEEPRDGIDEPYLHIPCQLPDDLVYFTIDPIDGTSAYTRKQSHGWGCMISLVHGTEVIAVCIGDSNSGELYYYRPGSQKTHRLIKRGQRVKNIDLHAQILNDDWSEQAISLRNLPSDHHWPTREFLAHSGWKKILIVNGSIGLSMAQLWKGEVAACLLQEEAVTPWDSTPIIGMTHRLGFDFWEISISPQRLGVFKRYRPEVPRVKQKLDSPRESLVLHKSLGQKLLEYARRRELLFRP